MRQHHRSHQEHHSRHHLQHQQSRTTNTMTDGIFLQDAWMSLAQNLQMQSITSFQHLNTQYIDQVVDMEMKRLRATCKREEDRYVEQMLLENPIIVERRTQSPSLQSIQQQQHPTPTAATDATPKTNDNNYPKHSTGNGSSNNTDRDGRTTTAPVASKAQEHQHQLLQQRAESCRRSRINNKIKKAKMKFRHKFMSNKLMQSVGILECIQKLIDQTEMQLVSQGFSGQQLEKLKELFCNVRL